MPRSDGHAPVGGLIPAALCEAPQGDVTTVQSDVTCTECLDAYDASGRSWAWLARHVVGLRAIR